MKHRNRYTKESEGAQKLRRLNGTAVKHKVEMEVKTTSGYRPVYINAAAHRHFKAFCAAEDVEMVEALEKAIDLLIEVYKRSR